MNLKYEDEANKTLSSQTRKDLAAQLKADIDDWCIKEFTGEHRGHLGASLIGEECSRKIWYGFRWVKFQVFNGRMLRLFQRGHEEEARFIRWLRAIGCTVWEVDPNTGKQFRIWGVNGHYGGSSDSVGITKYFPDLPMLLEFKTHNTKSFVNLVNKGVILSKPQHYSQMCSYGKHYNFRYAIYVAVNKNDDDLHIEVIELNPNIGHELLNKAQDIIESQIPPQRISNQPSYYECGWCNFKDICHYNEPVEKNCRSCKYAKPIQEAQWKCEKYSQIIPTEFISKGCSEYVSIN